MADFSLQSLGPSLVVLKWVIIVLFMLFLLRKLMSDKRYRKKKKLRNRTMIITGGNSGIGYATAVDLAKRRARIILACRDRRKGEMAASRIRHLTRNDNVVFKQLDLASFDSIRQFCRMVLTTETRVDVLINNAGIMASPLRRNEDGYEMQFMVNYLGNFLLTNLLINLLKKSDGKIINVTSNVYKLGEINLEDLNSETKYDPWRAYYQGELAKILFTRELSKRLRGSEVTVNAVYPGKTATNIRKYSSLFKYLLVKYLLLPVTWLMWQSPEQAAQRIIDLVLTENFEELTGMYFSNFKKQTLHDNAMDDNLACKLWERSVELVGLEQCKIMLKKRSIVDNGVK